MQKTNCQKEATRYWVQSYYLKENKAGDYQRFLHSDEAKQLWADAEAETGIRYMGTFWPILGFGEYDCEDWFEVPDWAAMDKIRESDAINRIYQKFFELELADNTRPQKTKMMRSTSDVSIFEPE